MGRHVFCYVKSLFYLCCLIPVASAILAMHAEASPIPATSTSAMTAPELGLFFTPKGFRLGTEGTNWLPQIDRSMSRGDEGTSWRFSNQKTTTAQVHLKTDFLKADLTLEAYAKRWIKDYSQLGMDVLGTRPFSFGGHRGVVVDLIQPKKKLQIRQAVFLKHRSVVILTCSDQQTQFESTLSECNRLIKNFSWNEINSQKSF